MKPTTVLALALLGAGSSCGSEADSPDDSADVSDVRADEVAAADTSVPSSEDVVDTTAPPLTDCTALVGRGTPPTGSLAALCALAATSAGAEPIVGPAVVVAPSAAMPKQVKSQDAHNNLDVEWHDGRLFLAFRTAPSHFADIDTVMYVVSTTDLDTWRYEGKFALGTDVREPQLVSFGGALSLTFAVLGDDPLSFKPQGSRRADYLGPESWTAASPVFDPDFIPWRIRARGDRVELIGYSGGANIYENDGEPIAVKWLTAKDGRNFEPVLPGHPVILEGGASETDIAVLDDGSLVAVSRNEAGDAEGFGSLICRATAQAPAEWTCVHDKKKYDSPLVFRSGDGVYLLARRNVTTTGNYDLDEDDKTLAQQYTDYQLAYWNQPKRCTLWRVDPDALAVTSLVDLPSRGDTCFPEVLELKPGVFVVFNYTSPLTTGTDPTWIDGQTGPTQIVYTSLQLPE